MKKRNRLPFKLEIPFRRKRGDIAGRVLPIFPFESENLYRYGSGFVKSREEAVKIKKILTKRYPNKKVEVIYFPSINYVKVNIYNIPKISKENKY